MRAQLLASTLLLLGACATEPKPGPSAPVFAAGETVAVKTRNADAADDPAIWASRKPIDVNGVISDGFIAGTDKKAGLYIYGFDGRVLQFLPEGLLNNVDIAPLPGRTGGILVLGASDRTPGRMGIRLFRFDPDKGGAVQPWGQIATDLEEPYGFCMRQVSGVVHAVVIGKDGQVRQFTLDEGPDGAPVATEVRRFAVGSISEGCVIDTLGGGLFISEELVGLWRYGVDPRSGAERRQVQAVDGERLTADVEGATIIEDGPLTRYLIVSSQGDSTFAVWRLGQTETWVGRFSIAGTKAIDGVSGTDGLDALGGKVGPFPDGLVVIQDDVNPGAAQNFKLVPWPAIKAALGLP